MVEKLGEMLVGRGLVTAAQLDAALRFQKKRGGKLGDVLIHLGFVDDLRMAEVLAEHHGLPLVLAENVELREDLVSLIPRETLEDEEVLPVKRDGSKLLLAMADPTALDLVEEIRFATGLEIDTVLIAHRDCRRLINRYFYGTSEPQKSKIRRAVTMRASAPGFAAFSGRSTAPASAGAVPAYPGAPAAAAARPERTPEMMALIAALIDLLCAKGLVSRDELQQATARRAVALNAAGASRPGAPPSAPEKPPTEPGHG